MCDVLVKKNTKALKALKSIKWRHYSFDINQFNQIFDCLVANERIGFREKHNTLPIEE